MVRKHTNAILGDVQYTPQEENDRDAEELAEQNKPPPTDADRIDDAFPQTDVAQVIVQVFLTMENQIRTLQDDLSIIADPSFIRRPPLVKRDIITFMKNRLP